MSQAPQDVTFKGELWVNIVQCQTVSQIAYFPGLPCGNAKIWGRWYKSP